MKGLLFLQPQFVDCWRPQKNWREKSCQPAKIFDPWHFYATNFKYWFCSLQLFIVKTITNGPNYRFWKSNIRHISPIYVYVGYNIRWLFHWRLKSTGNFTFSDLRLSHPNLDTSKTFQIKARIFCRIDIGTQRKFLVVFILFCTKQILFNVHLFHFIMF